MSEFSNKIDVPFVVVRKRQFIHAFDAIQFWRLVEKNCLNDSGKRHALYSLYFGIIGYQECAFVGRQKRFRWKNLPTPLRRSFFFCFCVQMFAAMTSNGRNETDDVSDSKLIIFCCGKVKIWPTTANFSLCDDLTDKPSKIITTF